MERRNLFSSLRGRGFTLHLVLTYHAHAPSALVAATFVTARYDDDDDDDDIARAARVCVMLVFFLFPKHLLSPILRYLIARLFISSFLVPASSSLIRFNL